MIKYFIISGMENKIGFFEVGFLVGFIGRFFWVGPFKNPPVFLGMYPGVWTLVGTPVSDIG